MEEHGVEKFGSDMCAHGNFVGTCELCLKAVPETQSPSLPQPGVEKSEGRVEYDRLQQSLAAVLESKPFVTDNELIALARESTGSEPTVYYHASAKRPWEAADPKYFDRQQIVLAGGHFSYRADNLSYGSYNPAELVQFRVIDGGKELCDTSETGEGTQVGHEAIAQRPLVLRKMDDRLYSRQEIESQSQLPAGFSATPEGVEDVKIRQLTYMIDHEATEHGTIAELLHDPAFAKKHLREYALETIARPMDFMDEKSVDELADLAELEASNYDEQETVVLLQEERREFGNWFRQALQGEEQMVRVLARERTDWQTKTNEMLRRVTKHQKFVDYYLNEFMPEYVSDGGMYRIEADELAAIRKTEENKIAQYRESPASS